MRLTNVGELSRCILRAKAQRDPVSLHTHTHTRKRVKLCVGIRLFSFFFISSSTFFLFLNAISRVIGTSRLNFFPFVNRRLHTRLTSGAQSDTLYAQVCLQTISNRKFISNWKFRQSINRHGCESHWNFEIKVGGGKHMCYYNYVGKGLFYLFFVMEVVKINKKSSRLTPEGNENSNFRIFF